MKKPSWRLRDLQPVVGRLHEVLEGWKGKELQASDALLGGESRRAWGGRPAPDVEHPRGLACLPRRS